MVRKQKNSHKCLIVDELIYFKVCLKKCIKEVVVVFHIKVCFFVVNFVDRGYVEVEVR
jgi:hypothetical protein